MKPIGMVMPTIILIFGENTGDPGLDGSAVPDAEFVEGVEDVDEDEDEDGNENEDVGKNVYENEEIGGVEVSVRVDIWFTI